MKKFLSIVATAAVLLNSFVTPFSALAQEVSSTPTPAPTDEAFLVTPAPGATETPELTPIPTDIATPTPTEISSPDSDLAEVPATLEIPTATDIPDANLPTGPPEEGSSDQNDPMQMSSPVASFTFTPQPQVSDPEISANVVRTKMISEVLQENDWIKLITDKLDYAPDEIVIISGSNFEPNKVYSLTVSSQNNPAISTTVGVSADNGGEFVYDYQLDGNYRPNYLVEVRNGQELIASTSFTDSLPPNFQCNIDSGGLNDDPGQKDLTQMCRDLNSTDPLSITWNWDEISMPGGNTADACSLFDTDNDGFANYSLCVTWENGQTQSSGSPNLYSCDDSRIDRCGGRTLVAITGSTNCSVGPGTEPFPSPGGDGYPGDTMASCSVDLSDVGGAAYANLLDVCSYPSNRPNSDPSDCVVIRFDKGNLNIIKDVVPNDPSTNWNFGVTGPTPYSTSIAGDGTSGIRSVDLGTYTITETAGAGTDLGKYSTTWSCTKNGDAYLSGSSTTASGIVIQKSGGTNDSIVCTFTNTLNEGTLVVQKTTIPASDPTTFTINATGSGVITGGGGGTISDSSDYSYTVTAGTYSVAETVPSGWSKTADTCQGVAVAAGQTVYCEITNTKLPTLTINKILVPSDNSGVFDLKIDGTAYASSVGNGGSTGPQVVSVGEHTFGEVAAGSTNINNYVKVFGGDPECNSNGTITLAAGENKTCTITNTALSSIQVMKNVVPDDSSTWDITLSGPGGPYTHTISEGSPYVFSYLSAGSYTVSEVTSDEYISVVSCGPKGSNQSGSITFDVTPGESITCVFTNTKYPTLNVVKALTPTSDPGLFDLRIDESTYRTDAGDNDSTGPKIVSIGSHTVSELAGTGTNLNDYNTTYSTNCAGGEITLSAGDEATCTIYNTRKTGNIVIDKIVEGGVAQASDWTFTILNVLGTYHNNDNITLNTGGYSISESGPDGYTLTEVSGICTQTASDSGSFTVTEAGGTCTFVNTRDTGSVRINKEYDFNSDGYIDGYNTGANTLGFAWNLDGGPNNAMGSTVGGVETTVGGTTHYVNEYIPADYHFSGWYRYGTGHSCRSPEGTTLPLNITVEKDTLTEITFCNTHNTGTIQVYKNVDLNGDGDYSDSNETNNHTWQWQAYGDAGANAAGYSGGVAQTVPTGNYTLAETLQENFHFIDLSCTGGVFEPSTKTVTVTNGANVICTFTNARDTGTITINKTALGGDDLFGFTIDGDGTDLNPNIQTTAGTGTTGVISVVTGNYSVSESTVPDGWDPTSVSCLNAAGAEVSTTFNLEYEGSITCTFTNTKLSDIHGYKYNDINGNGIADQDEPKLSGWKIFIDEDADGEWDEGEDFMLTSSDPDPLHFGWYWFENLPPGEYSICEEIQDNWVQTSTPACHTVTLPYDFGRNSCEPPMVNYVGEALPACNFGNQGTGTITIDKVTIPSGAEDNFTINLNQGPTIQDSIIFHTSVLSDQDTPDTFIVPVGPYWLEELVNGDWELTEVSCTDGEVTFDGRADGFELPLGGHLTCTFINTLNLPSVSIQKSNNGSGGINAGAEITYSLFVSNTGNTVLSGFLVQDVLPAGFSYVNGSTTGATTNDPAISGSTLSWKVSTLLNPGENLTISYRAITNSSLSDGIYTNFATCQAFSRSEREVDCNIANSIVTIGSVIGYGGNLEGQVLGLSTELPATGSPTIILAAALSMILTGVGLNYYNKKRYAKN